MGSGGILVIFTFFSMSQLFSLTFLLPCLLLLLPLLPTCQSCKASAPTSTSSTPAADIRSGKFLREEEEMPFTCPAGEMVEETVGVLGNSSNQLFVDLYNA